MSELDQLDAFEAVDTCGWLSRAAQIEQHIADAADGLHALRARQATAGIVPSPAPFSLILPPELQPIGELAARLMPQEAITVRPAQMDLGVPPQPGMQSGDRWVDLAPYIRSDAHPVATLVVLLGLPAIAHGQAPESPTLDPAVLAALTHCTPSTLTAENPAKQLALRLHDRIPCFWGAGLEAAAGRVWAARRLWLAESMALALDQDELSRLLAMARFPRFWPNAAGFVRLHSAGEPSPLADKLTWLLSRRRFATLDLHAPVTARPVDRALYWLALGEWVALYAAALNNVDPAAQVPLDLLFVA